MRKHLAALLLALLFFTPLPALGEIDLTAPAEAPAQEPPASLGPLSPAPLLETPPFVPNCAAALLMEAQTGQIIFEMNADTPRAVASVTKVMTILLALEAVDAGRIGLDDAVTISARAAGMGGSQALLDVGERQTVRTLLESMIVGSANDSAVALAEALYGSEELCAEAMNLRAEQLGMANTHFVNCTGLPAEGQRTTARDVAVMSRQLFADALYYEFSGIWMKDLDHGDGRITQMVNTNKLIRLYDGCDGGKTGSTNEAGYCVSATARRGGMRLIAVVLGGQTGKERFAIAQQMFDFGFAGYRLYPVAAKGARIKQKIPVIGGDGEEVALALDGELTLLVPKGGEKDIRLSPDLPERLEAPVAAGQRVGSVRVDVDGRTVSEIPVTAAHSVEAAGFGPGFRRLMENWLGFR